MLKSFFIFIKRYLFFFVFIVSSFSNLCANNIEKREGNDNEKDLTINIEKKGEKNVSHENDQLKNIILKNSHLKIEFNINDTLIVLTKIINQNTGFIHLNQASPLFEVQCESFGICQSNRGIIIDQFFITNDSTGLNVKFHAKGIPLSFTMNVSSSEEKEECFLFDLNITNLSFEKILIKAKFPCLQGLTTIREGGVMYAAIPQEIGSVISLEATAPCIGMQPNEQIGLPTAMNTMELVSIYDPYQSGGIFFADVEGDLEHNIAPLQFTLCKDKVTGYWASNIESNETVKIPKFAIGVHDTGDWHYAVDYYVKKHRLFWSFPEIPSWFREQGAIYGFSGGGGGGIFLEYPAQSLDMRISSFLDLPILLNEAKRLGTNIIYLWDYWEGSLQGGKPPYWNKGDYIPRSDLGGETAFREGIRRLHEQGGKIILYLEPFIIFEYSNIGIEKGQLWGGRDSQGNLYRHYEQNYSMIAPFNSWQDYLVSVAERLVRDYDADGIFLDSWAWQMNWPMQNIAEHNLYTSKQYSQGVLTLTDRIRTAIQTIKPDAVIIGETTSGPIAHHWHGGLSADFAWLADLNQNRIIASPVRYGIPEINFISNGRNLNELQQIYAAGYNLALTNFHLVWSQYINQLIKIRQDYKDALIYGKQLYQPSTGNSKVASYFFSGEQNDIITIVNTSEDQNYVGQIKLNESESNSTWKDLLTDQVFAVSGDLLNMVLYPEELKILLREKTNSIGNGNIPHVQGKYKIYPNPTKDEITIDFPSSLNNKIIKELIISDVCGRIIFQQKNIFSNKINIKNIKNGIYFFNIIFPDESLVCKLIKQ